MSTSTQTVSRWIKPVPFMGLLLAIGLILSYAVISTLPTLRSDPAAPGIEASILRGREADAARYTAMAQHFAAWEGANLQQGRAADTARYTAMAGYSAAKEAFNLQRGREADAARYTAMAEYFTALGAARK